MALYDNKYWLLSHIRNSFISTDDTGMCELVMVNEAKEIRQYLGNVESYPEPDDSEDEEDEFESYDLQMDMDFGIRERSNTAAQLEKLDLARKKAAKMKHIKWETSKEQPDINELFIKKDISQAVKKPERKSMLSVLMQNFSHLPMNPYIGYSKFDGCEQVNIPTRRYKIFLTMLSQQQRNYPINICCVATAKIQDLIGLTLLKFSTNHGDSNVNLKSVSNYGLFICEEDGEVDRDFPCLDPKECVAKFGFVCLGLVEHKENLKSVSFPDESQHTISEERMNRIRTISEKSKAEENRQKSDLMAMDEHNKRMEAPLYQSFRVFMLNKVRPKVEVNIGISGERIEIDPIQQKGSKLLAFKQRAVSHYMDTIAWCEITDTKSNKATFKLVYNSNFGTNYNSVDIGGIWKFLSPSSSFPPALQSSTSFKHYDFECDISTAQDIVQKIKLILEVRSSSSRKEYVAAREGKHYNKRKNILSLK
ncbi:hypothetical protein NQ315_005415 [Exocentrus adspersus]|uniref:Stress-activated map kinase-interacting protein 1 n=1 Tax=Exocentrus adspersus TaxID=1586481 RepID=A0AAV8W3P7_9CUCU|nr:hypothetical protein NQ315_005415 [Exocentrus adspersus]